MPLTSSIPWCKKVKNDQKLKIKGGGGPEYRKKKKEEIGMEDRGQEGKRMITKQSLRRSGPMWPICELTKKILKALSR